MHTFPLVTILDEDETDRMFLEEAFRELDEWPVKCYSDARHFTLELLYQSQQHTPALIIMEGRLHGRSAEEVIAVLKADESLQDVPIIVYSTGFSPQQEASLKQLGVYACIRKPDSFAQYRKHAEAFSLLVTGFQNRARAARTSRMEPQDRGKI